MGLHERSMTNTYFGGGGGGGITTLLDSIVTDIGGVASFNLSGIVSGYKKLEILCVCRATGNLTVLGMSFNGDTTATNYGSAVTLGGTSESDAGNNDNRIGYIMPSTQAAERFSYNKITIFDYDATDKYKVALAECSYLPDVGYYNYRVAFDWHNTDAITRINLAVTGGNIANGSRCIILGY